MNEGAFFLSNLEVHSQAVFLLSASVRFDGIQTRRSSRLKLAVAADGDVGRGGPGPPRPRARAAVAVLWAPGTSRGRALEECVVLRGGAFGRASGGKEGGILL